MVDVIDEFRGSYGFLSNFYPSPLLFEGDGYPTLEHAYQAAKTVNPAERKRIIAAQTPGAVKRIGRSLDLRSGWNTYIRYQVMEYLLSVKFALGKELSTSLVATANLVLVEGNSWHDNTWGSCYCSRVTCSSTGMNLLGWMLMRQRDFLIKQVPWSV